MKIIQKKLNDKITNATIIRDGRSIKELLDIRLRKNKYQYNKNDATIIR